MITASHSSVASGLIVLSLVCLPASPASAQPRTLRPAETPEQKAAAIERKLATTIDTAPFQQEMSFLEFLALLEKQLPPESKVTFRIHKEAFGKEYDKLVKTPTRLDRFPKRMSVETALRLALSRSSDWDDPPVYHVLPTHVRITTLEHTGETAIYDVADLVKESDFFLAEMKRPGFFGSSYDKPLVGPAWLSEATFKDGAKWIVQLIMTTVDPDSWHEGKAGGSIQVLNGAKLKVRAAAVWQKEVRALLDSLRRLADNAVVMNAKIVEVDRRFFDRKITPLLVDPKDTTKTRLAAPIGADLWKQLQRQKVIQESDDIKIKSRQIATFLSRQTAYRYRANPGDPITDPAAVYRTAQEGVTFQVQAEISSDRRCMRLKLTQETAQLVKMTKGKKVDLESGKEFEIDLPNVKTSSATATIEIHDGDAFVMPVHHRLSPTKDKTWLLFAEPIIWIEEEQEQIRLGNFVVPDPGHAQEEPAKEKPLPEPPKTDDVKEILQALVTDVLTNKDQEWKELMKIFSTGGDTAFTLEDGGMAWPKWFQPAVPGFKLHPKPGNCPAFEAKRMTIRLDVLDLKKMPKDPPPFGERPIQIYIDEVGGPGPRSIGGVRVGYNVKREGKGWIVERASWESP